MTLDSSSVSLFLTRHIWGSHRLWDSYLLEYSSWCHVLISAQKLRRGLHLFSSLKSKRNNEGGKGSTLNLSLGWQRWCSRNTLDGTEPDWGFISARGMQTQPWKMCEVSVAAPTTNRVVLMSTGEAQISERACSSKEPIYSFSEDHAYNADCITSPVTTPELFISYGAVLLSSSQPKASYLFYIITSRALSMKPAPDGHNHCNCWRSLYPLALLKHSIALFSSYFDGKDISGLPQSKSRTEISKALILSCCSSDRSSSMSGQFLHRNWALTAKDLTTVFLFH